MIPSDPSSPLPNNTDSISTPNRLMVAVGKSSDTPTSAEDDFAFHVISHGNLSNTKIASPVVLPSTELPTPEPQPVLDDDEEAAAFSQIIINEDYSDDVDDVENIDNEEQTIERAEEKDLQTGASEEGSLSASPEENPESTFLEFLDGADSEHTNGILETDNDPNISSSILINNSKGNKSPTIILEEKPTYMKHLEEDQTQEQWKRHQKHIFILSDAGKPIFTRYGDENQLNTIMSFFLGIVTIVSKEGGFVRTVNCGPLRFVYVVKGALYLVSAARTSESPAEIAKQLETIYEQLVFILTSKNIQDILQKRSNFDLRKMLGGTDKIIYSLINRMSNSVDFSFDSTKVLRLSKSVRTQIGDIMMKNRVENKLMFSILISDNRLIHMIRNKKYNMKTKDLLLLMNFVGSAHSSMKSSETWTPICLPGISETQYVYGYINYFTENWCYVMICMSTESFFDCQKSQNDTLQDLLQSECFLNVVNSAKIPEPTIAEVLSIKIPNMQPPPENSPHMQSCLRHFICRNKANSQIFGQTVASKFIPPYHTKKEQKRLLRLYKTTREKIEQYCKTISASQTKTYLFTTSSETVFGVWMGNLEIYATFSLNATKTDMLYVCEQIKAWIKKEDGTLFLPAIPTF